MDEEINKNEINEPEITIKSLKLKTKIFELFYIILNKKDKTSKFTLAVLHIMEIIQIISYAYFQPHLMIWKISPKAINIISSIISAFRLAPLLNYTSYDIYIICFILLFFLILAFFVIIIMQILFRKENSRIYNGLLSLTHIMIAPLTIFFFIPINELLLIIFRCDNNIINITNHVMKCWTKIHLLYLVLSIIGVLLFLISIIFLNFFYFYPFQSETSTIKLNSTIDVILLLIKIIYVLRLIFINNENLSIVILLLLSIFLLMSEFRNPTYNCNILEIIINIRNSLILWTFLILFISKLCEKTEINGLIYLVFVGYPIIIVISIIFTQESDNDFNFNNSNLHNIKT